MSSLTKPTGPLPENTYWKRRAAVLAVALLIVVGLGRLLTGGSDAADPEPAAGSESASLVSELGEAVSSATAEAAPTTGADPSVEPKAEKENQAKNPGKGKKAATESKDEASSEPTRLPDEVEPPRGECLAADVSVTPRVADQPAGRDISVRLLLQTAEAEACLWTASEETLTLKITSGSDNIWYSSECAKAMPNESVVLRNDQPTRVRMAWDARRSDEGCTKERKWALPGTYHLEAAALGGDPQSERFVLQTPTPETVKPTPKAEKKSDAKSDAKNGDGKNTKKKADKKSDKKKQTNG